MRIIVLGQVGCASGVVCFQVRQDWTRRNAGSSSTATIRKQTTSHQGNVLCRATEDISQTRETSRHTFDLPFASDKTLAPEENSTILDPPPETAEQENVVTVSDVLDGAVKAVQEARAMSVAQWALLGGAVAFGLVVTSTMMESLAVLPFAPEVLQTVGVAYSVLLTSQFLQGRSVSFPPPSPFKAVVQMVDAGQTPSRTIRLQDNLTLRKLAKERDAALRQVEELKITAENYARVKAEREALEAVSLQLAGERDAAMEEVSALKGAVVAMTSRIKGIEEKLEREVSQLKKQNEALETVAFQLAAERDSALQEAEDWKLNAEAYPQLREELQGLEMVAIELAQERDAALAEVEDLKKVVASLGEAASSASGLSSEQELFIKARVRALRSQFISVEQGYDEQKEKVDKFIGHLVQEYGAPQEWTGEYLRQILDSSASSKSRLGLPTGMNRVGNFTTQSST